MGRSNILNEGSSGKTLEPVEAAYVAGFVDGEGCLTIGRAVRAESRSGFTYEAIFAIGNTNYDALVSIMRTCGNGKIQLQDKRSRPEHKAMYRLIFSSNQIRRLLPQLRPFLRIKGAQADIVLRFLGSKVAGRNVTPELWQSFENMRAQVRALNARGRAVVPESLSVRPVKPMPKRRTEERPCGIDGCAREYFAKGYCFMHYRRLVNRPERRARLAASEA